MKGKLSKLEKRSEKEGLSKEEQLSIDKMIINLGERITALENRAAALTLEKVEIMKNTAGIVH